MNKVCVLFLSSFFLLISASAEVSLPNIFNNDMVLQQELDNKIWGWAQPQEAISVEIAGQKHKTVADAEGNWSLKLKPQKWGGPYELKITASNEIKFANVMFGEVWLCSGQSNMGWTVSNSYDADLESMTANFPNIRLIKVPLVGTQEPQKNINSKWEVCTPETVKSFSAVGYFYGRTLHQSTKIPVGLIMDAWGGSACEAWINRDLLKADSKYKEMITRWKKTESTWNETEAKAKYTKQLATWKVKSEQAKKENKPTPRKPRYRNPLTGQHRPANLYNGMIKPIIGYGLRGAIWYQGETNAGRAYQYRDLFPLMIKSWRDEWGIGNFPFYWVQLADFQKEATSPQQSSWAELREAQTMTMDKLPNTGEAVIIDLGEDKDIHPRNKQKVAQRLVRWPLAKIHKNKIPFASPRYKSMKTIGNKVQLTFVNTDKGLDTFDTKELLGFTIAGENKKFSNAKAKFINSTTIEIWSDDVASPIAVRYAWATNPICNIYTKGGLPLTPFRTDEWPSVTINNK
ncbi:MAG: sialate O-acetylesterase [Lentisphaeraceae bacterium]|nr:sialate O-acetylesterase [Lentisphaeraceae bacterium]